jgi:hypothetical protein
MWNIGETEIDENVAYERFACDLNRCRGACCTLAGGRGAPLIDEEVEILHQVLPEVIGYLDDTHKYLIEKEGIIEGVPGSFATICLDQKACGFVYYEFGIAKCSIERAWADKKISYRKPLSCHLFPLRINTSGRKRIRYESIPECMTARELGAKEEVFLHDFMKEALIRRYGEKWYIQFITDCMERVELKQKQSKKES